MSLGTGSETREGARFSQASMVNTGGDTGEDEGEVPRTVGQEELGMEGNPVWAGNLLGWPKKFI